MISLNLFENSLYGKSSSLSIKSYEGHTAFTVIRFEHIIENIVTNDGYVACSY